MVVARGVSPRDSGLFARRQRRRGLLQFPFPALTNQPQSFNTVCHAQGYRIVARGVSRAGLRLRCPQASRPSQSFPASLVNTTRATR